MFTDLAMRYNDNSVLENMHASRTFEIMRENNGKANIFGGLSKTDYVDARKVVLRTILATDMARHRTLLQDFDVVADSIRQGLVKKSHSRHSLQRYAIVLPSKSRDIMLRMMLHSADISNPTKKWETCRMWADKVCEEFFIQGDKELDEGIFVGPLRDRNQVNKAEMQISFGDFVVARTFGLLYGIMPAARKPVLNLIANRKKWLNIRTKEISQDPDMSEKDKISTTLQLETVAEAKEEEYAAFLKLPDKKIKRKDGKDSKEKETITVNMARARHLSKHKERMESIRKSES